MFGCYIWGALSDSIGRRIVLITSLGVTAVFGMFSSLAMNINSFIVLRFITGFGYNNSNTTTETRQCQNSTILLFVSVGGVIPVNFSYFAEFQPKGRRGRMLSSLTAFRTMGQVLIVGE